MPRKKNNMLRRNGDEVLKNIKSRRALHIALSVRVRISKCRRCPDKLPYAATVRSRTGKTPTARRGLCQWGKALQHIALALALSNTHSDKA